MPQLQICESAHHTMYGSIEKNMRELAKLRGIRALVHNAGENTILFIQEPISIVWKHRDFVQVYRQFLYNNNGRS